MKDTSKYFDVWPGWPIGEWSAFQADVNSATTFNLDLQWLKDKGWSVMLDAYPVNGMHYAPVAGQTYPGAPPTVPWFDTIEHTRTVLEPAFTRLNEYGIPCLLLITPLVRYNRDTMFGMPAVTWQALPTDSAYTQYNSIIEDIDSRWGPDGSEGDIFRGYWYEDPIPNSAIWLRDTTDLEIVWGLNATEIMFPQLWDIDEMITSFVDNVQMEVWVIDNLFAGGVIETAQYIRENYPTFPLGINSTPITTSNSAANWSYPNESPAPTTAMQISRSNAFLRTFKDMLGTPFDNAWFQNVWNWPVGYSPTPESWWVWMQYQATLWDNIQLQTQQTTLHITNIAYPTSS